MEHVRAKKGTTIYHIQTLANIPFYYCLNCNLTNKCYENIKAAGFDRVELDIFEADELVQPTPIVSFIHLLKTHVSGVATK